MFNSSGRSSSGTRWKIAAITAFAAPARNIREGGREGGRNKEGKKGRREEGKTAELRGERGEEKRGEGRGKRREKLHVTGALLTWESCCQPEKDEERWKRKSAAAAAAGAGAGAASAAAAAACC